MLSSAISDEYAE